MSKKKKYGLILPIIVSLISLLTTLIGVSLAWYSMNEPVQLGTISIQVEGVKGFEFSTTGAADTWMESVEIVDISTTDSSGASGTGLIPSKMIPITSAGLQDENGNVVFYRAQTSYRGERVCMLTQEYPTHPIEDGGVLTGWSTLTAQEMQTLGISTSELTPYIVFDLYMKTEGVEQILIKAGTKVSTSSVIGASLSTRIGFLNMGSINQTEYDSGSASGLASLQGLTDLDAVAKIFEPNCQWHAPDAITDYSTLSQGTEEAYYYAVKSSVTGENTGIPVSPLKPSWTPQGSSIVVKEEENVENGVSQTVGFYTYRYDALSKITPVQFTGSQVTQDILPDTATDLEKSLNVKNGVSYNLTDTVTESAYDGITDFSNYIIATVGIEGTTSYSKVRIYMWLEGNDLDCVNQVSGTNITFDLHLSSVNLLGGN